MKKLFNTEEELKALAQIITIFGRKTLMMEFQKAKEETLIQMRLELDLNEEDAEDILTLAVMQFLDK